MDVYFICELSWTVSYIQSCTFLMLKAKHMVTTGSKNIIIIVWWPLYPAICILLWEIVSIESSMLKNPLAPS